jgi:uncharacterized FlaG/YvyC family protein
MDIDIAKNVSAVKTQISSSHDKRPPKEVVAPHRNEEVAKNVEKVEQEALSVRVVRMNYDAGIDRVIITVVDSRSQEVELQIPETDSIAFMKRFQQMIQRTVNKKV